jgi:hypothetical protein
MSTAYRASLEQAMRTWIDAHSEDSGWPQWWYDSKLELRMADAAYAVFMAAREAQDFKEASEKKDG